VFVLEATRPPVEGASTSGAMPMPSWEQPEKPRPSREQPQRSERRSRKQPQSSREPPEQPKPTTRATRARALELVEAGSPVPTPPRVRYREGVGSVEDTGVWVLEF
jgi:hypothetical protein